MGCWGYLGWDEVLCACEIVVKLKSYTNLALVTREGELIGVNGAVVPALIGLGGGEEGL